MKIGVTLLQSWKKLTILVLFFVIVMQVIFVCPPQKIYALADTTVGVIADWGDVVNVTYSLWLDPEHTIEVVDNIDVDLVYVYLRRNENEFVPSEVYKAFPPEAADYLQRIYYQQFIDAIIGMRENETKDFMIAAEDIAGDEDQYYRIKLLAIVYDASGLTTNITTTTFETASTSITTLTPVTSNFETRESIPELTSLPDFLLLILFLSLGTLITRKSKEKNRS
jgi:hypothetical protein